MTDIKAGEPVEETYTQLTIPGMEEWLAEHLPPVDEPPPADALPLLRRLRREQAS